MTAPYKTERTLIGVAVESDQKTEVVPSRLPGFTTGNVTPPDMDIDWREEHPVGADRDLHDQVEGQRSFEGGSLTLHPYDGWPIAFALGAETVNADTPSTGLTEHVLTAKQDGPPPTATAEYTFIGETGQSDLVRAFVGVFPTSGEISQDNEGIMEMSLEHQALGITDDTPRSTFTDVRPVPDRDAWKFSDASSDLSMFGSTFASVNDFSLQFQTGAEPQYYIESTEAPEPYEATYGMTDYSLSATINVKDASIYNELVSPTTGGFSASLNFAKQHNADETLDIQCTDCRLESAPHNIPEQGPVQVDVTIIPRTITITVVDSQTAGTGYLAAGTAA